MCMMHIVLHYLWKVLLCMKSEDWCPWIMFTNTKKTRIHSCRMRTAHLLTISHHILCTHPQATTHAPQQPRTPPGNHACPRQPCMPPSNHKCPQPCMPPGNHTCPLATMHAPRQPRMPPNPLATTHAPSNHACPREQNDKQV